MRRSGVAGGLSALDTTSVARTSLPGTTACLVASACLFTCCTRRTGPCAPLLSAVPLCALGCLALNFGTFTCLAETKERGRAIDEGVATSRERAERACAALSRDYGLSAREKDTLQLLVLGHTRSYIAEQMGVSTGTVQTHLSHIYQKLDVHKREAVIEMVSRCQEDLDESTRYRTA